MKKNSLIVFKYAGYAREAFGLSTGLIPLN